MAQNKNNYFIPTILGYQSVYGKKHIPTFRSIMIPSTSASESNSVTLKMEAEMSSESSEQTYRRCNNCERHYLRSTAVQA